ncbi:hypothetical protein EON80_10030 [bacterium]|nr:MAG: hypothetical protein EON80_10030 [bacterium]
MNKSTKIRLAIAFLAAMIVTAACLMVTYEGVGIYVGDQQLANVEYLKSTDEAIKNYRKQEGTLPSSLTDLLADPNSPLRLQKGKVVDSWDHAVQYEAQGDNYDLSSYGRDGKPDGVGLDGDISMSDPQSLKAGPTFLQVIFDPMSEMMVWTAAASGLLTLGLAFWLVKPSDLSSHGNFLIVVKMGLTLLATVYFAICITSFHVPSGH